MSEDEKIKKLFSSVQKEAEPPEGVKERIFYNITQDDYEGNLTYLQKIFFIKPLRTAACLSICISSILYAFLGKSYTSILAAYIGLR